MYRNSNDDIYFFLVDHRDGVGDGIGEADDHVPGDSRPILQLSVLHVHVHVVVVTVLPVLVVVIILLIVIFLKSLSRVSSVLIESPYPGSLAWPPPSSPVLRVPLVEAVVLLVVVTPTPAIVTVV